MGLAQDFKNNFEGIQFFLVENAKGVGKFKSVCITIPEYQQEVFFEIIVSLKDKFFLPTDVLIQDIYNASEKIHNISQFENMPIKTHILFDYAYEKRI